MSRLFELLLLRLCSWLPLLFWRSIRQLVACLYLELSQPRKVLVKIDAE